MWPSFDTAVSVHDTANVFLVIALVVGVVATALVIWTGNIKEEYLKRDIAAAHERAAQANARGEEAKAVAAEAHERAAEANRAAEQERLERIKLEASITPRRLTVEQQKACAAALKNFSGRKVVLMRYSLDLEGAIIAKQIQACLGAAGITIKEGVMLPVSSFAIGVHVDGLDNDMVTALISALKNIGKLVVSRGSAAFNLSGIGMGVMPGDKDAAAKVLVGVKPIVESK